MNLHFVSSCTQKSVEVLPHYIIVILFCSCLTRKSLVTSLCPYQVGALYHTHEYNTTQTYVKMACTYVPMYVCTYLCTHSNTCTYTHMHTHTCRHTDTQKYIHTCINTCTYASTHTPTHAWTHVRTHTRTHAHARTHTHTHTHKQTNTYTVHCTKNFANPHKLLHHGLHLWRLALASHCSPQLGEQRFAKYGFIAGYMDS